MKKHIPNAITCCNLLSGCIATVCALDGNPSLALLWIVLGAVFDFFDGMSARLLGVSSPIGKELDSLADDVTFGVAPSAMVFFMLKDAFAGQPCLGAWAAYLPFVAFLMAAFSALRLAKFNLDERQTSSFIGLPTPANALFWGSLVVGYSDWLTSSPYYIYGVIAMLLVSCYLLVAELPLFALKFKHWGWHGNEVKYIFLGTSAVLFAVLGVKGIAVVIAWYVILAVATRKR